MWTKVAVKLSIAKANLNFISSLFFIDSTNDVGIGVGASGYTYPTGCDVLDKDEVLAYVRELDGRIPIQIQEAITEEDMTLRMVDVTDSQLITMVDDFYTYHGLS